MKVERKLFELMAQPVIYIDIIESPECQRFTKTNNGTRPRHTSQESSKSAHERKNETKFIVRLKSSTSANKSQMKGPLKALHMRSCAKTYKTQLSIDKSNKKVRI